MPSLVSHLRQTARPALASRAAVSLSFKKAGWLAARSLFILCSGLGVMTVVGCYLLSPLFCYWFFRNARFWRYLHLTLPMVLFTYYLTYLHLRGRSVSSFPWTSPPMSGPDPALVRIRSDWEHGESCGDCGKCCRKIKCPFQDKKNGHCLSYDSFYWRYFNCGRYPISQRDIDLYECPKWVMRRGLPES